MFDALHGRHWLIHLLGGILCGTCSFLSTEKKHGRYLHGNGRSQFLRSLQWRFISRTSRFAWDWCHFDFSLNSYRQNIDTEHEAICSRLHKESPVSWFNHVQPSGLRLLSRFLWGPYSKDSMYIACYTSLWFPSVQVCAKHSIDDRSIQMHKEMHIDHRPLYAVQWTSPLSSNDPSVVLVVLHQILGRFRSIWCMIQSISSELTSCLV